MLQCKSKARETELNNDDLVRTQKQMSKDTQCDFPKAKSKACDMLSKMLKKTMI